MGISSLILTVLGCIFGYKVLIFLKNYSKKWMIIRKIPGPQERAYPFIGHTLTMRGNPDELYTKILDRTKLGIAEGFEIFHIWMGPVPVIGIIGPNAAEVILRSSQHIQKSFFYTFLHSWLGTGLLTADGEKWKIRRKLLTPTFHFSILEDFLEVMNEQASVFTTKLDKFAKSGETFNICNPVTLCALDIICETAMGKSIHAQENKDSEYVKAIGRLSELIQHRQKSPWLWWDYIFDRTPRGREYARCLNILHSFTRSVVKDRMENFDSNVVNSKKKRLAFLDLLLKVSEGGKVLAVSDIQEEVDTFMFEGHDTTAAAMGWSLHLIGTHLDVQRKIQDELDKVLGDDPTRKITMEKVRQLEYLEMVIKESLRIFPSVPMIARTTSCDCHMDGHFVPAGTECLILPQVINTNDNFWTDSQRFDPERFTTENSVGRHPYSYLPFSAGPRNCIGQRFALMEEKVMLAYLLREFSVESCDATEDLRLMGDIILRPGDGINVKLRRRSVNDK